jgi:hypothetical protein
MHSLRLSVYISHLLEFENGNTAVCCGQEMGRV